MKKNDVFSVPQRQSRFAIIFIVLRSVKRIISQLWPLLLAALLGRGGSSRFDTLELAIAGIGLIGIIPAIIGYFKYYFHLSDTELIIHKGLFKKVKLNIPFERIQSVNFTQTAIHQFLKVTEVEIETAGSTEQETKIDALDIPTAELLRKRILEKKAAVTQLTGEFSDVQEEVELETEERTTILKLPTRELLKVGLVQNHLKPLGLILGLCSTIFYYSYTFDWDFDPRTFLRTAFSYVEDLDYYLAIVVIILILIASVLYSIVTTVLRYYNLHFWRAGNKFQVVQGLFTRQEFAALDNKVQILNWGQNPLERLIGFYNIVFSQAKSGEVKKGSAKFKIPGCSIEQVEFVQEAWLGIKGLPFDKYSTVSPHFFYHTAMYLLLFSSILTAGAIYAGKILSALMIILILIIFLYLNWINYKKKRYAINSTELYVGGGTLGLRHSLLPLYKIQDVNIVENPYQWRRKLSTLVVNTAGGAIKIPYIPKEEALKLMDELIYEVERSKKSWM